MPYTDQRNHDHYTCENTVTDDHCMRCGFWTGLEPRPQVAKRAAVLGLPWSLQLLRNLRDGQAGGWRQANTNQYRVKGRAKSGPSGIDLPLQRDPIGGRKP